MIAIRKGLPLLILLLLVAGSAHAATWTTIDVPGARYTDVLGINTAGDMVGDYVDFSGHQRGFLFKDGVFTTIEPPGAIGSIARGINDLGQISGEYLAEGTQNLYGFFFDGQGYTTLDFPGASGTTAWGTNNAGEVVGYYFLDVPPGIHGFKWSSGIFTTIDFPGSQQRTELWRINNIGQIVGQSDFGPFLLTADGDFRRLAPSNTVAYGLNDHKVVVGTVSFYGYRFNLKTKTLVQMQFHQELLTRCYEINNNKQIVGNYDDRHHETHGFVWTK